MAARNAVRCANLLRTASRNVRITTVEGLCVGGLKIHKFQGVQNKSSTVYNLVKNSSKTYSTATAVAAIQFSPTNSLSLLGNADVRCLSGISSSSLTESGGEEDDEQNCPPYSGVIKDVQDEMLKGEKSGQIFAVIHIGGRQFKVTINDTIVINRIDADTGERIRIEKVLMIGGENFSVIGTPLLVRDLSKIEATVVEKTKSPKVIVFKKKRRKGYKRTHGHRQDITVLRINSIHLQPSLLTESH
ncbi:PREDICTED: 39S ribosomal protein L21, mitochondrial-like [Acropora digitifera]|uniref:39S ribosomal protein L21, mitochondrial-like n=1 Tax=Acropora digitifera TaxID=70779 RepID=UPI00077A31BB|nr:PREDICTED: 39S ribosomal protein L21, mitochondrial-like [Acropora digitifera]